MEQKLKIKQTSLLLIRENTDELYIDELKKIAEKLDEKVIEYDKKIEECEVGSERKKYRSERKYPKQALKRFKDFIKRKEKYEKDMEIFGERNSYSKTDRKSTRLNSSHVA